MNKTRNLETKKILSEFCSIYEELGDSGTSDLA